MARAVAKMEWTTTGKEWTKQDLLDLYHQKTSRNLIPLGNSHRETHNVLYGCGHTVTLEISKPFKTIEEVALTLKCVNCGGYYGNNKLQGYEE